MKKLLLSLVCVLGLLGGLRAQEETISIGSGNSSSYRTPINTDQPYSVSQQIYSADEIGKGAGKISKIAFIIIGIGVLIGLSLIGTGIYKNMKINERYSEKNIAKVEKQIEEEKAAEEQEAEE